VAGLKAVRVTRATGAESNVYECYKPLFIPFDLSADLTQIIYYLAYTPDYASRSMHGTFYL